METNYGPLLPGVLWGSVGYSVSALIDGYYSNVDDYNCCWCLVTSLSSASSFSTVYGRFWKRWKYQTTWPASWENHEGQEATGRTGHGTTDWFQIGKGVHQGCILSPCFLTYMQSESESKVSQSCLTLCNPMDCSLLGSSVHGIFQARVLEWVAISFSRGSSWTRVSRIVARHFTIWATWEAHIQNISCEMPGWMKHKLESRLLGEISITSDTQTTLMAESEEELKSLLMKVKEESETSGLNFTFRKWRSWHLVPSLHCK